VKVADAGKLERPFRDACGDMTRPANIPQHERAAGFTVEFAKTENVLFPMAAFRCFLCGASASPESLRGGGKMTTRIEKALIALSIASLVAAAAAGSETINYTYDSRGRLLRVKHSGSVNNNVTANYQYDKADNRTNVNVTSPNAPPP
jgi:YD repeat-containing protein